MKSYSLILSKYTDKPAMRVPFRWVLTLVQKIFLENCDFYVIKDQWGAVVFKQEISRP